MSKLGNAGAERGVLAGLVQFGKEAYFDVSDIINVNSFSIENNQLIYKCFEKALEGNDKVDAASLFAAADSLGLSELLLKNKTDIEFIRSLFNFPIQLGNVRPLAKQIAKLEFIRKSQASLKEAHDKLSLFDGTESIDEILAVPENSVFLLTNEINNKNDSNPKRLCEDAEARLRWLAENPVEMKGIPSPFGIYNDLIGGGLRSGVHLIGARPKVGKSTLSINIGWHISNNLNIPVLYIDTEMSNEEQEDRIISHVSEVDFKLVETGKFGKSPHLSHKVFGAIDEIKNSRFFHKRVGGKEFEEIISIMRRWILSEVKLDENGNTNPHLIIYDYFKLMNDNVLGKMQEHQAIGFQVSYLSDFCKEYDTPCLAFTQLNRDGITKDTSDILSQSDRLLWLCTSVAVFKPKDGDEIAQDGYKNGNRKLFILDTRFGKKLEDGDYINMQFEGDICKVSELGTKFKMMKSAESGFEVNHTTVEDSTDDIQ